MFESAPLLLGQYRPLDSYLHRLDARAKLLPVLLVMVLALLTGAVLFYAIMIVALFAALLWSGVSLQAVLRNVRPLVILVAITFLYHIIFTGRDSAPLFTVFGFAITTQGVASAAFFSLRLMLFVTIAFLVTLTSSPSDLAESLTKMLRPLERLRLPISEWGLILFIAIRFIPVLYDEFATIRSAQMIRGVDFSGRLLDRVRKTTAIIVPVLMSAVSRADDLAIAMEARGYRSGQRRTFYSRSRFDIRAWTFLCGSSLAVIALFTLTYR